MDLIDFSHHSILISRLVEKDETLITGDGLHPSGKMYTEWVRLAVPEIVKMLKETK